MSCLHRNKKLVRKFVVTSGYDVNTCVSTYQMQVDECLFYYAAPPSFAFSFVHATFEPRRTFFAIGTEDVSFRVQNGSTIDIYCRAIGNDIPVIQWSKNNETITYSGRINASNSVSQYRNEHGIRMDTYSTLSIKNFQLQDVGAYTCIATNAAGTTDSGNITLSS